MHELVPIVLLVVELVSGSPLDPVSTCRSSTAKLGRRAAKADGRSGKDCQCAKHNKESELSLFVTPSHIIILSALSHSHSPSLCILLYIYICVLSTTASTASSLVHLLEQFFAKSTPLGLIFTCSNTPLSHSNRQPTPTICGMFSCRQFQLACDTARKVS